ncbi:MAG: uroporphyrinogen decarboxylase family protein, partial [Candidatus Bathyarchaeia archaeon]
RFPIAFRPVKMKRKSVPFVPTKVSPDGPYIGHFGLHRRGGDIYLELARPHALEYAETVEEVEEDPYWMEPEEEMSVEGLRKQAERIEGEGYAVVAPNPSYGGVFEASWFRRGFEKFIEDMYFRPKIATAIIDRVVKIQIALYDMLLDEVGDIVTVIGTGDDLAGQTAPILSPKIYRKYIKPAEKRVIDAVRRKTDAKVFFHACGYEVPFMDDLIEIGVDILHPVQPECPGQDLAMLKERWGEKLTFCGGVGSQHILPRGSPSEVEAEVKRCIEAAARGGGYIVAPGHCVQPEVPPWNLCAMYDAVLKYGEYPITL